MRAPADQDQVAQHESTEADQGHRPQPAGYLHGHNLPSAPRAASQRWISQKRPKISKPFLGTTYVSRPQAFRPSPVELPREVRAAGGGRRGPSFAEVGVTTGGRRGPRFAVLGRKASGRDT
ncbi:hypothetical protein Are01nite_48760 [Actinoplanes regularis]|nr:hypothetical protein Are01nite_48760 [Actinoplanes regularis]